MRIFHAVSTQSCVSTTASKEQSAVVVQNYMTNVKTQQEIITVTLRLGQWDRPPPIGQNYAAVPGVQSELVLQESEKAPPIFELWLAWTMSPAPNHRAWDALTGLCDLIGLYCMPNVQSRSLISQDESFLKLSLVGLVSPASSNHRAGLGEISVRACAPRLARMLWQSSSNILSLSPENAGNYFHLLMNHHYAKSNRIQLPPKEVGTVLKGTVSRDFFCFVFSSIS